MGSRRRRAAGGVALRSVRGRAVAADVRRRNGRAAVREVLRMGRRREARGPVFDHRAIASRAGSTTSRRWRSANRATTSSCWRSATPRSSCRPISAASTPRLGSRARRAFSHPLGNAGFPFRWFFSRGPVPVEGDGTTVMRISWNRLTPFAAWEHPSWRQIFDVGDWD